MATLIPILRFLHIAAAIFWAGSSFFTVFFLEPTVRSLGPDGGKFMQRLIGGARFSLAISLAATITVLAGLAMYFPVTASSPQVMLGARIAQAGGPPSAADLTEMGRLQGVIRQGGMLNAALMAIAVIGMTWRAPV